MQKHAAIHRRRRGITLAEVVICTLIVGVMAVTAMQAVGGIARTWQVVDGQFDGHHLAQLMLAEVLQASYVDPGGAPVFGRESGESGGARTDWDDTDDYDDWTSTPPQDKDGNSLPGYAGWTRAVIVQKTQPSDPSTTLGDTAQDKGLRRITVTVTDPAGKQTVLRALRAAMGAMEQPPGSDTTYVTWVGVKLQSSSGTSLNLGTNVINLATDQ